MAPTAAPAKLRRLAAAAEDTRAPSFPMTDPVIVGRFVYYLISAFQPCRHRHAPPADRARTCKGDGAGAANHGLGFLMIAACAGRSKLPMRERWTRCVRVTERVPWPEAAFT